VLCGSCPSQALGPPSVPQGCHVGCQLRGSLTAGGCRGHGVCAPSGTCARGGSQQVGARGRCKLCSRSSGRPPAGVRPLCASAAARAQGQVRGVAASSVCPRPRGVGGVSPWLTQASGASVCREGVCPRVTCRRRVCGHGLPGGVENGPGSPIVTEGGMTPVCHPPS